MDRTICAKERSRDRGFSASRGPTDALRFRGGCVRARTVPALRERSRPAGQPLTRFLDAAPRLRGCGGARLLRQSRPDRCVTFPGRMRTGADRSRAEGAITACGAAADAVSRRGPAIAGLRRSQMCFRFTKTFWPGGIPRTPNDTSARHQRRPPDMVRLRQRVREPDGRGCRPAPTAVTRRLRTRPGRSAPRPAISTESG